MFETSNGERGKDVAKSKFFEDDPFLPLLNFQADEVIQRRFDWKQKTRSLVTQDDLKALRGLVGTNYRSWFELVHSQRTAKMAGTSIHPAHAVNWLETLNSAELSPTRRRNQVRANFDVLVSSNFGGAAYPQYLSDEAVYQVNTDILGKHFENSDFVAYTHDFAQWMMLVTGRKYFYLIYGPAQRPHSIEYQQDLEQQGELKDLAVKYLKVTQGMKYVEPAPEILARSDTGILKPVAEPEGKTIKGRWICPVCQSSCGGVCLYA